MLARLFAFVCLSQFALCSRLPEPVVPLQRTLVVFLKGAAGLNPSSLLAMKREIQNLAGSAGFEIEFRTAGTNPVSGMLVVTEFKGECRAGASVAEAAPTARTDLATTAVSDGHILPFSQVNCPLISRLLAPELAKRNPVLRDTLYGRALGRILAHEIYHILADVTQHTTTGVAKSQFTADDLLTPQFAFEDSALQRMSPSPVLVATARHGMADNIAAKTLDAESER